MAGAVGDPVEVLGVLSHRLQDHAQDRDVVLLAIDSTKLQRELGWRPAHTDFAEGLKATIDWYVENESWWRPAKEATEARYRAQGQ